MTTSDIMAANASLTFRDTQHNHAAQVHVLLRQIRALPGLGRFMLGEDFDVLRSVASSHPVVVLIGSRGYFYALLLRPERHECILMPLTVKENELRTTSSQEYVARSPRGASAALGDCIELDSDRGVKTARVQLPSAASRWMQYIWLQIVKPILDQLGLEVSHDRISAVGMLKLMSTSSRRRATFDPDYTGIPPVFSRLSLYMQLAFTTDLSIRVFAVLTTWCLLTLPRSRRSSALRGPRRLFV
jgi:hypothetical protein